MRHTLLLLLLSMIGSQFAARSQTTDFAGEWDEDAAARTITVLAINENVQKLYLVRTDAEGKVLKLPLNGYPDQIYGDAVEMTHLGDGVYGLDNVQIDHGFYISVDNLVGSLFGAPLWAVNPAVNDHLNPLNATLELPYRVPEAAKYSIMVFPTNSAAAETDYNEKRALVYIKTDAADVSDYPEDIYIWPSMSTSSIKIPIYDKEKGLYGGYYEPGDRFSMTYEPRNSSPAFAYGPKSISSSEISTSEGEPLKQFSTDDFTVPGGAWGETRLVVFNLSAEGNVAYVSEPVDPEAMRNMTSGTMYLVPLGTDGAMQYNKIGMFENSELMENLTEDATQYYELHPANLDAGFLFSSHNNPWSLVSTYDWAVNPPLVNYPNPLLVGYNGTYYTAPEDGTLYTVRVIPSFKLNGQTYGSTLELIPERSDPDQKTYPKVLYVLNDQQNVIGTLETGSDGKATGVVDFTHQFYICYEPVYLNNLYAFGPTTTGVDVAINEPVASERPSSIRYQFTSNPQPGSTEPGTYFGEYDFANNTFTLRSPIQTGIEDMATGVKPQQQTPVYYTLQGVRCAEPTPGMVVIRVDGNGAEKILMR